MLVFGKNIVTNVRYYGLLIKVYVQHTDMCLEFLEKMKKLNFAYRRSLYDITTADIK